MKHLPASSRVRIYIARHGQTSWNLAGRLQGWTDIPLNDTGRAQAQRLAHMLVNESLDHIYCSPLLRSRETAEALADRAPVTVLSALRERALGVFEGRSLRENAALREAYLRRRRDPYDDLEGGESLVRHYDRVHQAVTTICEKHRGGRVLLVGHGATNAQVIRALLNLPAESANTLRQKNDELFLVDWPCPKGEWHTVPFP